MLVIKDQKYFDSVLAFAKSVGMEDQLQGRLNYLDNYAGKDNTECVLMKDFAPYSFFFQMYRKGVDKMWFNGGLIFHGKHDGGGSGAMPTLSVCVNPEDGWSIHT